MRVLTSLFIVLGAVQVILSKGLNLEFTWSRLTYQWPPRGTPLAERFGGYSGSNENQNQEQGSGIHFPGSTNSGGRGRNRYSQPNQSHPQNKPQTDDSSASARYGSGSSNQGSYGSRRPVRPSNGGHQNQNGNSAGNSNNAAQQQQGANLENFEYMHQNNIPMGANVWKNKLFITVPRRRNGVPSTVNFVWMNSTQKDNVPLIPYPSWENNVLTQGLSNREYQHKFVSVYRVAVDECDRMWFLDTGIIEIPNNRTQVAPMKLVAIDLNTDKIVQSYELPQSVIGCNSIPAYVTVDASKNKCQEAFVYVPDVSGYGLIVYSLQQNKAWRVNHNYFFLEPQSGEFHISGHRFQWNDGIFSAALSDVRADGNRDMVFHSMAGTHLYSVPTSVLKNENTATRSYHQEDFKVLGDRGKNTQTSATDMHKKSGILFMGLVNQNALGCWNSQSDVKNMDIVQRDDETMIYPCDVKVSKDKVVVLTNRMPEFLYGQLDYDQTNFRVWMQTVDEAIAGTKCAPQRGHQGGYGNGGGSYGR